MLRTKQWKCPCIVLALCLLMGTCAATPAGMPDYSDKPDFSAMPGGLENKSGVAVSGEDKDVTETASDLTIQKEPAKETLYLEALGSATVGTQKFTTVRRGDFILEATAAATVVYPKEERITYNFPYGNTYFIETVNTEKKNKKAGDAIARIYVAIDEIQLAVLERQIQRMEERGETGAEYEEAKEQLVEMQKAIEATEIVVEKDCILVEQETFGNAYITTISSYTIVVADPKERLLEVSNENKSFHYGQKVKVSAKIDGITQTGTGTVITASPGMVSEELTGTTALIRLDEESEYLYDGSGISVKVETVHMNDVLLMDVAASYMKNGVQLVKVKDEYGLHAVGFSFGRQNSSTYWVIDGLKEGAQILVQ